MFLTQTGGGGRRGFWREGPKGGPSGPEGSGGAPGGGGGAGAQAAGRRWLNDRPATGDRIPGFIVWQPAGQLPAVLAWAECRPWSTITARAKRGLADRQRSAASTGDWADPRARRSRPPVEQ